MAEPQLGPCGPWIDEDAVTACCDGLVETVDPTLMAQAIAMSTNILFRLSGRQFPGICERTVRPCFGDNCGCGVDRFDRLRYGWDGMNDWPWQFPTWPVLIGGEMFNVGCCGGRCHLECVTLPSPVSSVTEVVIDGVVLDPSAYRVVQYRQLCRVDGGSWPCSQDYTKDSSPGSPDAVGSWQITYSYGRGPGIDGQMAAAIFACEIAKARCGADNCVLPQRLKEIVRDGVTMEFADALDFLTVTKPPRVGIYEVDMWLRSVNPEGLQRRATVRRVDQPKRWREFT
jgi:hypothetical protein